MNTNDDPEQAEFLARKAAKAQKAAEDAANEAALKAQEEIVLNLPAGHVAAAAHRHGPTSPKCVICGGPMLAGGVLCANRSHAQGNRGTVPPQVEAQFAREETGPTPTTAPSMGRAVRRTHAGPRIVVEVPSAPATQRPEHQKHERGIGALAGVLPPELVQRIRDNPEAQALADRIGEILAS